MEDYIIAAITALYAIVCICLAARIEYDRRKLKEEIFSLREKTLRELAWDGICYAAEIAAKRLKYEGEKTPGEEKRSLAIGYVVELFDVDPERAGRAIDSVLAKINREGATGNSKIQ